MRSMTLALCLTLLASTWIARADDLSQGATYHADAARSGDFVMPGLTWASAPSMQRVTGFAGVTTGNVNNQPLYWRAPGASHGMVVATTDQNVVQAFDPITGTSLWRTALGPVDLQPIPNCGLPRDQGIYGTPVIDPSKGVLYVVGSIRDADGSDQYGVWALSLADGAVQTGWPVMIASGLAQLGKRFDTIIHDQRTALTLVNGRLYAGFAANNGDCSNYHGWVVGLDTGTATVVAGWRSRAIRAGVWATGGVVSDGASLFGTTGNAIEPDHWADGETVFRFAPTLVRVTSTHDFFVPADYATLDQDDYDLGGSAPLPIDLPLPDGGVARWLLQIGKGGVAYILDRANLGGVGGELAATAVAKPPIIVTGVAFPTTSGVTFAFPAVGTGCPGSTAAGIVALGVAAIPQPSVTTQWCAPPEGSLGIPIATTTDGRTDPIIWVTTGAGSTFLLGLRGDTGVSVFKSPVENDCLASVPRHTTILAAEGRLFIGAQGRVCAFAFAPR